MEGEEGGVFGSSDKARRNKDGGGKGKRGLGIVNAKICKRCTEILKTG